MQTMLLPAEAGVPMLLIGDGAPRMRPHEKVSLKICVPFV
jgi:hypothetical protein